MSLPPRVPGLPLLGNTLAVLRDPSGFLVESYRHFGPAYRVNVFGKDYTVMAGQEALRFLATVGELHFSREAFYRRFARELGAREFILGIQGTRHRQLHTVMKLGFSRQVAEPYIPAMVDNVRRRAEEWAAGQTLSVPRLMADLTFDAYSLVMAGAPLREYFQDALVYSETIMRVGAMVRPSLLLYLPRYRRAKRRVFSMMNRLIGEHRAHREEPDREFDLLDALLDATQGKGPKFSDTDVVATALYGFVGTLVYLNRLLAYLLYELLKDSKLCDQVTREADAVLSSGPPNAQGLRRMSALHDAYLETLRFHPVALGLPFLVEQDFEFAGSLIRKGQRVVLTPLPVHFSPQFYTDPNSFDSSRCAEPRHEVHAPAAFAPFGFAGRVCAAVGLVEITTLTTIATLLKTVRLQLEPADYKVKTELDPLPGPEPGFTVRVIGLRPPIAVVPPLPQIEERLPVVPPGLTPLEFNQLLSRVSTADYEPGSFIVNEGERAEHFFILLEGEVEVLKLRKAPQEDMVLATLGPGDYFGEIGLLRKVPRTASVRARSAVKVLVVDRDAFLTFVADSDLVSEQISATVRRRVMATRLAEAFPRLNRDQLAQFLPNFTVARYPPGGTIVRQGDPSDAFFVITSGRVEVVSHRPGGQDLVLHELGAGEWFGEMGIILGAARTATVRATVDSEVEVMIVSKDDFLKMIAESGPTRTDVSRIMLERFLSASENQRRSD